jgi:hypothetical protein
MSILRPGPPVIAGVLGFLAIERALETGACPGVRANEDPHGAVDLLSKYSAVARHGTYKGLNQPRCQLASDFVLVNVRMD